MEKMIGSIDSLKHISIKGCDQSGIVIMGSKSILETWVNHKMGDKEDK